MIRTISIIVTMIGLSACSSLPSLDDVGSLVGLSSDESRAIALREECAALDMAISANLNTSRQATEEELKFAEAFRKQSDRTLDQAVRLRMKQDGVDRRTAFEETSGNVRSLTSQKAVYISERVIADDSGILDNVWVNDQRLECQDGLS